MVFLLIGAFALFKTSLSPGMEVQLATGWAMITMYGSVANRTVEIGTLRALGLRRRSILLAFLGESFVLSVAGGHWDRTGVVPAVFYDLNLELRVFLRNRFHVLALAGHHCDIDGLCAPDELGGWIFAGAASGTARYHPGLANGMG